MVKDTDPIFRMLAAATGSYLVELVHGGFDSTSDMPELGHILATYSPIILGGAFVAMGNYGPRTPNTKKLDFVAGASASGFAGFSGYLTGRLLVSGLKKIVYE